MRAHQLGVKMEESQKGERAPIGELYSRAYLEAGPAASDSPRLRSRVLAFHRRHLSSFNSQIRDAMHLFMGVEIRVSGITEAHYDFRTFYEDGSLRDFRDAITLIWRVIDGSGNKRLAELWAKSVDLAMREENVEYRVDERGGVHPRIDAEFEHNRTATIAALQALRYRAALDQFESAHRALDELPPNGKNAIRDTFECLETLFKLACGEPKVQRLNSRGVEQRLKPIVLPLYATNGPAREAAGRMCDSFADWINAGHQYRHAPGEQEPMPPPLDITVLLVSAGASWIRWLAELDRKINGGS
jgi:hypothetical protein